METKENATHSAFLCEMLNPKGSHLKGNLFLKLFLECVHNQELDVESACVKVEHVIGTRDDQNKTGGRVDIYIWDKMNNTICIENKINALEQNAQIERYCKHNPGKNTVYYLTKFGDQPTSAGSFVQDQNYYSLSYQNDIANWLRLCMKEAYDAPILRESIKQYLLLINKLTHTMDSKEQEELFNLILRNHEEATIIAANYRQAVGQVLDKFRNDLYNALLVKLKDKYNIYLSNEDVYRKWSIIWLKIKGKHESRMFFGISSFAIDEVESLRIGIFTMNANDPDNSALGQKETNWWYELKNFSDFKGAKVKLNDSETIKRLKFENGFWIGLMEQIVSETTDYLEEQHNKVDKLLANV